MTTIMKNLRYTPTHEWVRHDDEGNLIVGITDHAQALLGDIVFVELPEVKKEFSSGKEAAVLESVKAAADVYCPVGGVVVAVNHKLTDNPALINSSPYEEGWIFKLHPNDPNSYNDLMDVNRYENQISGHVA